MEAASAPPVEDTNAAATAMMGLFHLASASAADPEQPHAPADADYEQLALAAAARNLTQHAAAAPRRRADHELHEDDARRQYTGVYWDAGRKKWKAQIAIETKLEALGRFDRKSDAARAYDERARTLGRGLNFPRPGEASTKLRSRPQHVRTGKTFRKQHGGKGAQRKPRAPAPAQVLGPVSLECNEATAVAANGDATISFQ